MFRTQQQENETCIYKASSSVRAHNHCGEQTCPTAQHCESGSGSIAYLEYLPPPPTHTHTQREAEVNQAEAGALVWNGIK